MKLESLKISPLRYDYIASVEMTISHMNLDNLKAIKRLDKKNVAASINNLPRQLTASWEIAKKTKIPPAFGKAKNIIFCGMGGSNLASELLKRVFGTKIRVPFIMVRGYKLPGFAGKNSLVVIDSYSGNTEETVSCLEQALKLKAKIICIASGGKIELLAKRNKLTLFKLNAALNPSGQPRYDVGSQLGTALSIFSKLKFISISDKEIAAAADKLLEMGQNLSPSAKQNFNFSKQLAQRLIGQNLYIVGAEHLSANAHILANQINESAKQLAIPYRIPELNHHLLEALTFPKRTVKETAFIFLVSPNYSERIMKRFITTKKILDQKGIANFSMTAKSSGALNQALEILAIGSWVSFYLAMANGIDPAEIPWVDLFKRELEK